MTAIARAKTLGELKAQVGEPGPGFEFFVDARPGLTVNLYVCPTTSDASPPGDLPAGSRLVGVVEYATHEDMLADRS